LFQGAAIIFLAHIYGVSLSSSSLGGIIFATFLVSLTVAPVPSSGVVTMTPALATIGVPVSGLGLILGIDRIPDMMRSCVNLLGQIAATIIVEQHIKNKNQLNT
jgi:Na+/H+-dicarboxylate symporter